MRISKKLACAVTAFVLICIFCADIYAVSASDIQSFEQLSPNEFPCKLEVSAPKTVVKDEVFELVFHWSEYDFEGYLSAISVEFAFDTRFIVLESATTDTVTLVGVQGYWVDGCNYGDGRGLGAVEAIDKNQSNMQKISIGFANFEEDMSANEEFTVKIRFKAVYEGVADFDWIYHEFYNYNYEYGFSTYMTAPEFKITVVDENGNIPEDNHEGNSSIPADDNNDIDSAVKGDVNADGSVDSLDAAQVLKHDASLIGLEVLALENADVNVDGFVDSLDAAQILKFDAMLIDSFDPVTDNVISEEESAVVEGSEESYYEASFGNAS